MKRLSILAHIGYDFALSSQGNDDAIDQIGKYVESTQQKRSIGMNDALSDVEKMDITEEVHATQLGDQDANDQEIERLSATIPRHLQERLAVRFAQPGVQEEEERESAHAREHSGSRSSRR